MGGILGYGLNPTPEEAEAVPVQVAEQHFSREELIRLVVESGTIGLYRTEPAWRPMLRQICFSLIPDFTSPQIGFLAQAAFLVLPGLLQKMRMKKKDDKPVDWLRKAQQEASKAHFILSQAKDYLLWWTQETVEPRHRQVSRDSNIRKKAFALTRDGRKRAAKRVACSDQDQPANNRSISAVEHAAILEKLHSNRPLDLPNDSSIQEASQLINLFPHDRVIDVLLSMDTDKAKGVSGWTNGAVKQIFCFKDDNCNLIPVVSQMFQYMFLGKLDRDLWTMSRSVLIPKRDTTKLRPLGIGECFYRIMARLVCRDLRGACKSELSPLQVGCGVSGGAEIAGRIIQLSMKADTDNQAISLDITNAFPNISRGRIWHSLTGPFEQLRHSFKWMYGGPSAIYNSKGKLLLHTETGVMQGDPLSSLFFCVAFQGSLKKIYTEVEELHAVGQSPIETFFGGRVIAYMDDITILSHGQHVDRCIEVAGRILGEVGMQLNSSKTTVIRGFRKETQYKGSVANVNVGVILGVPIGHDVAERKIMLSEISDEISRELDTLDRADVHRFVKFNIIRSCINTSLTYLDRVYDDTENEYIDFVKQVDKRVDLSILRLASLPETLFNENVHLKRSIIRELPQRLGGLGLGRHSGWHGEKSRYLSEQITREQLLDYYQDVQDIMEAMGNWKVSRMDRIMNGAPVESWWEQENGEAPVVRGVEDPAMVPVVEIVDDLAVEQEGDYKKKAREKTASFHDCGREKVLLTLRTQGQRDWMAWFRSSSFRGSGRWLQGVGGNLQGQFQLTQDNQYMIALRLRLLDGTISLNRTSCPECGRVLDPQHQSLHLLDCKKGRWYWIKRHNVVRDLLAATCKRLGYAVEVEKEVYRPPAPAPDQGASANAAEALRADVVYRDNAQSVLIDVTIADPAGESYARLHPDEVEDAVAKERESQKRLHYDRVRPNYHIVPFVVEATGRLGPAARTWMKDTFRDPMVRAALRDRIGAKIMQLNICLILQLRHNVAAVDSLNVENTTLGLENPGAN